jgi:hypothetical protein
MDKFIVATFAVPGFHCWNNAPKKYDYLGRKHRHLFYVRVVLPVAHVNRDVEFIEFGQIVKQWLLDNHPLSGMAGVCDFDTLSCEAIAVELVQKFSLSQCSVMEDNENGAIVYA